ncbi:HEAT repeat domain-containing protein [Saccharothrix xinjiangensis]|uniref:HEAT repeat domain-containing protein n=1 Tax=Saccharothrix xinjiangensis TaxID=204798 RepID=A0ABV9Y2W3_9PSEU
MTQVPRAAAVAVLVELRDLAGKPSYEAIAQRTAAASGAELSKATVGNILKGRTEPRPENLDALVEALLACARSRRREVEGGPEHWRARYLDALPDGRATAVERDDEVVADYLARVRERFGRIQLDTLIPLNDQDEHPPMGLRDVFVGQAVRADPPPVELPRELLRRLVEAGALADGELPLGLDREVVDRLHSTYQQRPRRPVLSVLAHPSSTRTVVLGDPGAGKSTLARYLALALAGGVDLPPALEPLRGALPLVIELRTYVSRGWSGGDFLDLVEHLHLYERFGLPRDRADALLSERDVVVVFDGLDEVFDPAQREVVSHRIVGFATRYPRAKVVVTSRVVGYQRAVLDTAGFSHHMLQDLARDQIAGFVRRWYGTAYPHDAAEADRMRRRLITAVDDSRAVAELAGNPMLLTILAIIGRRRALPRDRRTVYEHAVTVLVEHWDISKHLADARADRDLPYIDHSDKLELLRRVARRMQDASAGLAGNHIPGPDLTAEFEAYLKDRYELPAHQAKAVAKEMLRQFHQRNFILSRFGGEVYGFVHRAFLEYLAAADIDHRFHQERSLSEEDLVERVFGERWSDPAWHEVLRHVTGMLDPRFAGPVIDRLLTADPDWPRAPERLPHHLVLAIQCLGEVRRLGVLTEQSRAVGRAVVDLLVVAGMRHRRYDSALTDLIEKEVVPALTAFGPHWAGREDYRTWYRDNLVALRRQGGRREPVVLVLATRIAALLSESDRFAAQLREQLATSEDFAVRLAAITGLTCGGAVDAGMTELLRHLAARDPNTRVRRKAIEVLSREAADHPDALTWFIDLLGSEWDPSVQIALARALTDGWRDAPEVLERLRELLDSSTPNGLRREAITLLTENWAPDLDLLASLRHIASTDESKWVRTAAVAAVPRGWAHDPTVLPWLRDLAVNADEPQVRSTAVEAVAKRWGRADGVFDWLRDLATRDISPSVRSAAISAVGEHRGSDTEVERWLRDRAERDPSYSVRRTAVAAATADVDWLLRIVGTERDEMVRDRAITLLAKRWGADPAVADWLWRTASTDPSYGIRNTALSNAAVHTAVEDLRQRLYDVLDTDPDVLVRTTAVELVADGWAHDPATLAWLRERFEGDPTRSELVDAITGLTWAHPATSAWLRGVASDPSRGESTRAAALNAVADGWGHEPGVLDWLRDVARFDVSPTLRRHAVRKVAACRSGETGLITWLREVARTDWHADVREAAIDAVDDHSSGDDPVDWLVEIIHSDPDDGPRDTAIWAISRRPALRDQVRDLAESDGDPAIRRTALWAFASDLASDARTVAWFWERVAHDPDPEVRVAALNQLAEVRADDLPGRLRDLVTGDASGRVRAAAAIMLAESLPDPADAARLLWEVVTGDPDHTAREVALRAVVSGWGRVDEVLALAVEHPDDRLRAVAVRLVAETRPNRPATAGWLRERVARDAGPRVREVALELVAQYPEHRAGTLEEMRRTAVSDPEWRVRLAALTTIGDVSFPGVEVTRWLRRIAETDPDDAVGARASSAAAAAGIAQPDTAAWLRGYATGDRGWHPRGTAVELSVLVGAHLSDTPEWLRGLAVTDDDPLVRGLALEWLALGWSHDPGVLAWLHDLGADAALPGDRCAAIRAVAAARPFAPDTRRWLRTRAEDPDPAVRATARRELNHLEV